MIYLDHGNNFVQFNVECTFQGGGALDTSLAINGLLLGARSKFWGVESRVPWRWRDSYGKMGNFGRVGDKSMFKMYKKAGTGREGDI